MPELTLEPYQLDAVTWLSAEKNRMFAGDPGIGKTPIGVKLCDRLGALRVFVICPAIAVEVWRRHFRDWSSVKRQLVVVRNGADLRNHHETLSVVFILSYTLAAMRKDITAVMLDEELFDQLDVMILDEAHALKNLASQRTQRVYGFEAQRDHSFVSRADRVYALTGSPTPNDATELYPHLRALAPELITTNLGEPMDEVQFQQRYTTGQWAPDGWRVSGNRNAAELRARIAPFIKRVRKKDVFPGYREPLVAAYELPAGVLPKSFSADTIPAWAMSVDDDEVLEALNADDGALAKERHEVGLAKIEGVGQLVENDLAARSDEKIVVFAHHLDVIAGLVKRLKAERPLVITGATAEHLRTLYVDAFQTQREPRLIIIQTLAGGQVITLTKSHNVILAEPDWVPENNRQAISRCDRYGQTERVLARLVTIPGTVDDVIARVLARKIRDISFLIDGERTAVATSSRGAAPQFPPLDTENPEWAT